MSKLPCSGLPLVPTAPGAGAFPIPTMPPMMVEKVELATGEKTNLLGYACEKFEIKQPGEVMEIWATDKLLPFRPWLQNQPHRFGPRTIEKQWGDLLKAKKPFPLRAVPKFENGPERLRFKVQSVTPQKLKTRTAHYSSRPATTTKSNRCRFRNEAGRM